MISLYPFFGTVMPPLLFAHRLAFYRRIGVSLRSQAAFPTEAQQVRVNGSLCQKSVLPEMQTDMSTETKAQVLARLRRRYATAGLEQKTKLLDQPGLQRAVGGLTGSVTVMPSRAASTRSVPH